MPDRLASLPLYAQALIAARMARRAALAMLGGEDLARAIAACDAYERITLGVGWQSQQRIHDAAQRIRRTSATNAALEAMRWAFSSAGAAEGANDFPVDGVVTDSARRCLAAVEGDRRVSVVQVRIIIDADADQLGFACGECNIKTYDPLTPGVFSRLAPCHALALGEARRSPEEEAR